MFSLQFFLLRMRPVSILRPAILLALLVQSEGSRTCQRPSSWKIGQLNPLAEARSKGHVVILGLLLAS